MTKTQPSDYYAKQLAALEDIKARLKLVKDGKAQLIGLQDALKAWPTQELGDWQDAVAVGFRRQPLEDARKVKRPRISKASKTSKSAKGSALSNAKAELLQQDRRRAASLLIGASPKHASTLAIAWRKGQGLPYEELLRAVSDAGSLKKFAAKEYKVSSELKAKKVAKAVAKPRKTKAPRAG